MKRKIKFNISFLFYGVALLYTIGFVVSCYSVTIYVMSLFEAGSITFMSDWVDIVLYDWNNMGLFFAIVIILVGIDHGLRLLNKLKLAQFSLNQ